MSRCEGDKMQVHESNVYYHQLTNSTTPLATTDPLNNTSYPSFLNKHIFNHLLFFNTLYLNWNTLPALSLTV